VIPKLHGPDLCHRFGNRRHPVPACRSGLQRGSFLRAGSPTCRHIGPRACHGARTFAKYAGLLPGDEPGCRRDDQSRGSPKDHRVARGRGVAGAGSIVYEYKPSMEWHHSACRYSNDRHSGLEKLGVPVPLSECPMKKTALGDRRTSSRADLRQRLTPGQSPGQS